MSGSEGEREAVEAAYARWRGSRSGRTAPPGQLRSEWVALVTARRHGTVPAGAVPSLAVVPLTSGLAHA